MHDDGNDVADIEPQALEKGLSERAPSLFVAGFVKGARASERHAPVKTPLTSRWQSYLSLPIWYQHPLGVVPVGAISVASMYDSWDSVLSTQSAHGLARATALLSLVGEAIVDPTYGSLQMLESSLKS